MPNMSMTFLFLLQLHKKSSISPKGKEQIENIQNSKKNRFIGNPNIRSIKKYQNFPSKKKEEKDIKCFKRGKKRHIAPNCKIKEIIVELDIGKYLKRQMINLIKTESDSSSYSPMETSNDNQFLLIEKSSSNESTNSSSQSSCDCVENCLCQIK